MTIGGSCRAIIIIILFSVAVISLLLTTTMYRPRNFNKQHSPTLQFFAQAFVPISTSTTNKFRRITTSTPHLLRHHYQAIDCSCFGHRARGFPSTITATNAVVYSSWYGRIPARANCKNSPVAIPFTITGRIFSSSSSFPENLYREWTLEQDQLLWEHYCKNNMHKKSDDAELVALLGRGLRGVQRRLEKLKDPDSAAYERLFVQNKNNNNNGTGRGSNL